MAKKKYVLNVMERTNSGSAVARKLRREGKVPAIVYGHGADPQRLIIDKKEWNILSKHDIQIIELNIVNGKTLNVLIKEVQYNYLTNTTMHIDFLEVKMDEIITASVPIHSHGTPVGLAQGGILDQLMHDIEVNCTPLTLPESIVAEVSELGLDSSILVGDLIFPDGVTPVPEADQSVFQVKMPSIVEEAGKEGEAEEGEKGEEGNETEEGEGKSGEKAKESE